MSNHASFCGAVRFGTRVRSTSLCLALFALCTSMPATAAKVYRCGNVFQDQPCPEVKIAAISPVERPLEVARSSTRDTPCASRDARNDCVAKAVAPRDGPTETRR